MKIPVLPYLNANSDDLELYSQQLLHDLRERNVDGCPPELLLRMGLVLEREVRAALMISMTWNELRTWYQSWSGTPRRELRKSLGLISSFPDQALRNVRYYASLHDPRKFKPSLSDCVLLLSGLHHSNLQCGLRGISPADLKSWLKMLLVVQKVRNRYTHGPFEELELEEAEQFLLAWNSSMVMIVQWKNRSLCLPLLADRSQAIAS